MESATKLENDDLLEQARTLVDELTAGNGSAAEQLIDQLGRLREQSLFQELGKMTRELHEALNGFAVDTRMHALASDDIPDAKARLNHVIEMTESSADRTLTAVENTLPIAEQLQSQASVLREKWGRFRNKDMSVEEFRDMSKEIDGFLLTTSDHAEKIHSNLSDVMMAQDFQDLTGQIIRRVIKLVTEVEGNLVGLIRLSGEQDNAKPKKDANNVGEAELMQGVGPLVPGVAEVGEAVSGQDEVDDLLSSLGF